MKKFAIRFFNSDYQLINYINVNEISKEDIVQLHVTEDYKTLYYYTSIDFTSGRITNEIVQHIKNYRTLFLNFQENINSEIPSTTKELDSLTNTTITQETEELLNGSIQHFEELSLMRKKFMELFADEKDIKFREIIVESLMNTIQNTFNRSSWEYLLPEEPTLFNDENMENLVNNFLREIQLGPNYIRYSPI